MTEKYTHNWFNYIRPQVLKRADGKCEKCGAVGGRVHSETGKRTILTVVHWNGNSKKNDGMESGGACPATSQYANVIAVCQLCHKKNQLRLEMKAAAGIRDDQLSFSFYKDDIEV